MAKAYIVLTNRIDQFKDEFNNLTNKVGDLATLTTGGFVGIGSGPLSPKTFSGADSSAIEAINEVDYRLDSIDQLLDQAVKQASNVEFNEFIAKDSAEFRNNVVVDGNTNLAGELIVQDSAEFMNNVVIDGKLNVAGNTTMAGTLTVDGQVTFKAGADNNINLGDAATDTITLTGEVNSHIIPDSDATYNLGSSSKQWEDLHVHGVANLDGIKGDSAAFTAGVTVGTTLGVTGTSTLGVINASGLASLDAGIDVDGAFTVANSTGNVATSGTLGVTGLTTLNGGITADGGAFSVANTTGNVVTTGTLNVSGLASLDGGIDMDGAFTVADTNGNVATTGTLDVSGLASLDGGIDADGAFTVANTTGNVATTGTLDVSGLASLDGGIDADGAFTVANTTGNIATSGTLDVTGLASLDGGIDVDGAFTVANTSGNIATSGTLDVTGLVTADGGIDVDNMHIDDTSIALSSGDLTVSAAGDIYIKPTGDDVYFRGTTSNEQIKFTMGTTTQTVAVSDALVLDATGNITLDADGSVIEYKDGGTQFGALRQENGDLRIASGTSSDARGLTFTANGGRSNSQFHGVVTFDSDITVNGNITTTGSQKNASNEIRLLDGTSSGATPSSPTYDATLSVRRGTQDSAELFWDEDNNIWKIGTKNDKQTVARYGDAVTFGSVLVDNTTINANAITRASGNLTLETSTSGDIYLKPTGDDVFFQGVTSGEQIRFTMGTSTQTITASDALTLDAVGDISLDADGGDVFLKDAGITFGSLTNTSGNLIIKSGTTTAATFAGANVTFAGTITGGSLNTSASDLVGAINELKAQETTAPRAALSGGNSITYTSGTGEIAVTTNSIAVSEMAGIDSNGTKYRALASNGSGNFIWTRKVPSIFDSDGTLLN